MFSCVTRVYCHQLCHDWKSIVWPFKIFNSPIQAGLLGKHLDGSPENNAVWSLIRTANEIDLNYLYSMCTLKISGCYSSLQLIIVFLMQPKQCRSQAMADVKVVDFSFLFVCFFFFWLVGKVVRKLPFQPRTFCKPTKYSCCLKQEEKTCELIAWVNALMGHWPSLCLSGRKKRIQPQLSTFAVWIM